MNTVQKSAFFKALGDPIRLKIIGYLSKQKKCSCICELSDFIKRDQSVVFRHIRILQSVGIVKTNKESRFLRCCVRDQERIKKYLED